MIAPGRGRAHRTAASFSFGRWQDEVREARCPEGQVDKRPGGCGDIEFFLIEVKFDALRDEAERSFLKQLPTSFSLTPEQVDILRATARRIMAESPEYARLLKRIGKTK